MSQDEPKQLTLSVKEASRYSGIGRNSLYAFIRSGRLPIVPVGRTYRISVKALERFVEEESQVR